MIGFQRLSGKAENPLAPSPGTLGEGWGCRRQVTELGMGWPAWLQAGASRCIRPSSAVRIRLDPQPLLP